MLNTFTIIGDPHITPKSLIKGLKLCQTVEDLGNPCIWTGDLLDTKEVIRGACQNLLFDYFKSSKLQHIVLVGNHDWFNLQCKDHSLRTLSALPNVKIIDSPINHPTLPFTFIPYIHDQQVLKSVLKDYSDPNRVLFGHFDVAGYDYGNGHICENGLTHADLSGFKRVISGHFHKLQQTGNFTYIGTPFSHSFGEANQDKVLGIYTLDTDKLDLIPTDFPRHVSLKLDMSKRGSQKRLDEFLSENKNNIARVQLYGTPESVSKLDKSLYAELNIKWEDKSEQQESVHNVDENTDNKSQFMTWAKTIRQLDTETVNLGISILESLNVK